MNQVAQTVPVCTFFVEELKHQGPEKAGVWPYRREQGGCRSGSVPALAVGSAGLAPVIPASGPSDSRHWSQWFQPLAPVIPGTGSNAEHIAKPCCPGCRTSRKMYLRKGKTLSRREEQVKNKCKKEIYKHQGQKEGGEGLLPALEQRFSCSFSNRVQQSKCFPVATGEEHVWSDVHTADQENPPKSSWIFPKGTPRFLLAGAAAHGTDCCTCSQPPAKLSEWGRRTRQEGRSEAEPGKKGWRLMRKVV